MGDKKITGLKIGKLTRKLEDTSVDVPAEPQEPKQEELDAKKKALEKISKGRGSALFPRVGW